MQAPFVASYLGFVSKAATCICSNMFTLLSSWCLGMSESLRNSVEGVKAIRLTFLLCMHLHACWLTSKLPESPRCQTCDCGAFRTPTARFAACVHDTSPVICPPIRTF